MYTTTHPRQAPWRRSDDDDVHEHRGEVWISKTAESYLDHSRGTLIKDVPEHFWHSSERVRQLANPGQVQKLTRTHEASHEWSQKGQQENLSRDATTDEDSGSATSEHETRQVKRKLKMKPSSSNSLTRIRDEKVSP